MRGNCTTEDEPGTSSSCMLVQPDESLDLFAVVRQEGQGDGLDADPLLRASPHDRRGPVRACLMRGRRARRQSRARSEALEAVFNFDSCRSMRRKNERLASLVGEPMHYRCTTAQPDAWSSLVISRWRRSPLRRSGVAAP